MTCPRLCMNDTELGNINCTAESDLEQTAAVFEGRCDIAPLQDPLRVIVRLIEFISFGRP